MGIRSTLGALLGRSPRVSESDVRRVAEEVLASHASSGTGGDAALEERLAKLEKKLNMAMGAVQAATSQIMALKKDTEEAAAAARQAGQHATTAKATAEAASDGLSAVEEQLASLSEKLGTAPVPKAVNGPSKGCKVPGCNNAHRASGYCARHYQQWKRGTLDA